jgi:uncharacterized membrane protein
MFVRLTGLAALAAGLLVAAPVQAAPAPAAGSKAASQAESVKRVAETDGDDDAACTRARRRLWVEGEGWVVRRVTTCR